MKRKGLFRSVVAMVMVVVLVCSELPVMPQSITKVFAEEEESINTAPETGVDLAAKYGQYINADYQYIGNYKSGEDEIVLTSYESQRGDIVLEWPGVTDAAYYDIFRNGKLITSVAYDNQMSYDDGAVEGSMTYNYVVFARNNVDEIVGTSNVYTAATKEAMVVSSSVSLDSDKTVFSLDIISGGSLNLNGHTLTVCRDITVSDNRELNISTGKVYSYGNIIVGNEEKYGYINLTDANAYLYVAGNLECRKGSLYFENGTVEIGGNLTVDENAYISCSVPNTIIFSGFDAQYVSIPISNSFAEIELRNYSTDGVIFNEAYSYSSIKTNNSTFKIAEQSVDNLILTADMIIEGDYTLNGGTISLNGHQLTITGDLIQNGGIVEADDGVLNITGDYIQLSGRLNVNGGTVNIGGNYRMQSRTGTEGNYTYGQNEAYLYMTSDEDKVNVAGSFYCASSRMQQNTLNAGTLSISGDFEFYTSRGYYYFETYNSHKLVLNGTGRQTIKADYLSEYSTYIRLANIEIQNATDGNVVFNHNDNIIVKKSINDNGHVFGGRIQLENSGTVIANNVLSGSLLLDYNSRNFYDAIEIKGNLYLRTYCYIYNDVTVGGNVYIGEQYTYNSNSGDEIYEYTKYKSGDIYLYGQQYYSDYYGNLYVAGSIICDPYYSQSFYNYGGIVSIGGDLLLNDSTSYASESSGNGAKYIFCGTQKQTIHVPDNMYLGNVIIQNASDEGVVATSGFRYESIEKNGHNFAFSNDTGKIGWTLSADEVVDGDLVLVSGTLNLNGHKLEVKGNLIQPGGTVYVNGGKLYIGGDYRIQSVGENEYGQSAGALVMDNENDEVYINGGFYSSSSRSSSYNNLTAGVMDVKGDFTIDGSYSNYVFSATGSHKVIFSGESSQSVIFTNCSYSNAYLNNVEITNPGNGNVFFGTEERSVLFYGEFNDNGHSIGGCIQPIGNASFTNGTFNGSIYITNSGSISGTFHITGDVILKNSLSLYGTMTVDGDIVYAASTYLYLYSNDNTRSFLEVKGDIRATEDCTNCTLYFYRGSLKLHGNLNIPCCTVSAETYYITAEDTNKFILCGTDKQTIEVTSNSSFGQIIIENTSEAGVFSYEKLNAFSIKDDNNKLRYGKYVGNEDTEGRFGWTLQEDETIDKDLILYDKILNLNGHTLTVNGDLIQAGGQIYINKGTLVVKGDYRVQTRTVSEKGFAYADSTGTLKMVNTEDIVEIGGNYYNQSTKYGSGLLTAGKMYIGGDLYLLKSSVFMPTESHTVIFNVSRYNKRLSANYSQSGHHYVSSSSSFSFRNLEIEADNYVYLGSSYISVSGNLNDNGTTVGGTLYIYPGISFTNDTYHGNVYVYGGGDYDKSYIINGNLTVTSNAKFNGNLTVNGNVYINNGYSLYLNGEDSIFTVDGELRQYYNSKLYLNNKTSNFIGTTSGNSIYAYGNYTYMYFNCETVNCHKNMLVYNTGDSISCKAGTVFNFCGNTAQTVSLYDNYKFSDIVINNTSSEGVTFTKTVLYDSLVTNGHKVRFGSNDFETGLTLTEDTEIPGDYYLGEGTLDLNGYNLTIKGNLYHTAGKIILKGGKLTVEKNYYLTGLNNSGAVSGKSNGTLVMTEESDHFLVKGNVKITQNTTSTESGPNTLTAGTFEMMGDCDVTYDTLKGSGSFKVVFSGSKERTVTGYIRAASFENNCTADASGNLGDILMNGYLYISDEVKDAGQNIKGSGYLSIYDLAVINGNSYSGNVYLNYTSVYDESSSTTIYSECTMTKDLTIGGSLEVRCILNMGEYCLKAGKISVYNQLNIQKGKIVCDGDLYMGYNGILEMTDDNASIFVKGDFNTYSSSSTDRPLTVNFTAGTFELQGNFTDNYTPSSFNSSGTNTVILSGKTVNGSDFIQSIKISDTKTKFNKLILKKPDTAYKFSRSIKKIAKNVERDVDTSGIPSNVSDITAVSTESSVKLIYSEATDDHGVTGYRICRNGSVCGATTALTFTDTGLKPNTTYTYTVYAIDAENNISESSPSVTITTKADNSRPEPVKSMSVSKRTGSSVTLTWKAAVDNVGIKEYEVYRKDDSGDYALIAEHVKKTTYKDAGIIAGVSYKYYLVAIDTSGNRSENGVVINASASSPRIISVYPEDGDKFGGKKIEFNVTYDNWGNSQNNTVTIEYEDRNDEWQPVTSYPLSQYADQYNANRLYSKYTWSFENADFNDSVRFKITLTDEDNNTAEKIVSYIIDRTAPAVPEEFEATDNGGVVKLLWAPSASDDCAGYIIYRSTTPGQEYSKLDSVDGRRNLVYLDKTVKKNVKYYYAIEAYDEFNNISEKAESGEVVVEEDRQLPVVKSIGPTETVIGNGTVTISVKAEDNKAVQSVALSIKGVEESHWSTLCDDVPCTDGIALYNLNTAAYTDGDYYILAKAIDVDGNVSLEAKKRFTFDNTGISKTTLTGTPVSSTVIELVWGQELLESDFAYYSVEKLVRIDDGVPVYAQVDKVYYNYNCISNLLPGEENTYIVVGYDICGNRGVESDPVTVATFVDTEGPSITWINKSGTPYSDIIPLSVTATDDLALKYAVFKYLTKEGNYEEIERIEAPSNTKEHTFICNWNVSNLDQGNVYVLYEVYDTTGHKNLLTADGQDVTAYFIIDRTAPGKVTGLKLDKSSGSVDISWDEPKADAEVDKVASFVVMREEVSDNGSGSIEYYRNIKSLYYSDENVSIGNEYIYRVAAVDIAGNQGEFTDALRVCVDVDNIVPEIQWINSNYRTVLPINPEIHILATDNRNLASLYVEYASADSDNKTWNLMYQGAISGTIKDEKIIWNTDGLTEGKYTVRAYATDEKGNESAYKTAEFTLDLTAPEKPVLNVKNGNMYIDIEIEGTVPEDFKTYEIYRRESGSTVGKCIHSGTEKTYHDTDVKALGVYYYHVAIYDIHDNKVLSDEKEGVASNIDDTAPEAILTSEILTGVVGEDVTLSGCNSRDNVGITEYKWFIDDTYIGKGIEIKHKFTEAKDYKLKLEVYDRAGNVGIAEGTVKISEKETTGTFVITVKSEDGAPLAGATVFIEEANGSSNNVMLNSNASCSFTREPGDYRVAAYVDGYLPDEISVSINAQEKKEYEIKLKKDKLLKAKASVRKLEPQELAQKGVDISNPANYNTVEVKFDVIINNQPYQGTALASPDSPAIVSVGGSEDSSNGKLMITMTRNSEPVIIYYEARPAVSWLKDFYEVYVSITNQASSVYSVDDLKATINLPQYISFAALTNRVQTETIELGNLQGQDSCSASWIVKSSVSKKYTFNVDINGIVMPFNTPYETKAVAEGYIDATSGSNLHLFIVINKAKALYDTEFVDYVLINEGKNTFNNVSIVLSDESIEYNVGDKEYDVEIDKNKVKIGTLKPWEPLSLRSSVTDTIGKAYKESNLNYHIDYLRGKNLGIQISVVDELPDLYHKEGEVKTEYGDLKWEVKYGILTVEGTGDYDDPKKSPSSVKAPWHDGETEKHIGKAVIDVKNMTLTTAMFKDCSKLKEFSFKNGTAKVKNMSRMFENCTSLTKIKMEQLKSSVVTDTSYMFLNCSSLSDFDGSDFMTRLVTNITGMFKYCSALTKLDLSSWDFYNVDKLDNFLYGCKKLTKIESPNRTPSEDISLKDCYKGATWEMKNGSEIEEVTSIAKKRKFSYTYTRTGSYNPVYDIWFNYASTMIPLKYKAKDVKYGYYIDFRQFFNSSYDYQHGLIKASIRTAMAAFDRNDYDVEYRNKNILDLMAALGFEEPESDYPETGYNTIGYAIGNRDIFSDDGDEATLILVAIRGQGYELEWGGDFIVGTEQEHLGFEKAAEKVIKGNDGKGGLLKYIEDYGSDFKDKIKIWVVGYSRGAATANLVCEKIIDGKAGIDGIDPTDVFGFCFECPRTTTSSNPHAEKYNGIKCVVNPIDFVPMVPMNNGANWNFERYGITYTTGALDSSNYDTLENNMVVQYRKILKAQGISNENEEVDRRLKTYSGNFYTQEQFCTSVFNKLADNTVDRSTYVNNLQSKLVPLVTELMMYTLEAFPHSANFKEAVIRLIVDYSIARDSGLATLTEIGYFTNTGFADMAIHMLDISQAHFSEQCLAWVDSTSEFGLYHEPSLSTYYLVYYDDNGGTGAPPPIMSRNHDEEIRISEIEPTREGYLFAGWMLDVNKDYGKVSYYPGDVLYNANNGTKLYANWISDENTCRVTLKNYEKDDGRITYKFIKKGKELTLPKEKNGDNEILYWCHANTYGVDKYKPGTKVTINDNIIFSALWDIDGEWDNDTVTVTYDYSDGITPNKTDVVPKKMSGKYIVTESPKYKNCNFIYWVDVKTDAKYLPGQEVYLYGDLTLKAEIAYKNLLQPILQEKYGTDKFPDELFLNKQDPMWIEIPEKDTVVCLRTVASDNGNVNSYNTYHSYAVVFRLNESGQICADQYIGLTELEINPIEIVYNLARLKLSTLPGEKAKWALIGLSIGKNGFDFIFGLALPEVSTVLGVTDTVFEACKYAADIISYIISNDITIGKGYKAFVAKYSDDFDESTLRGIVSIANDIYDLLAKYGVDAIKDIDKISKVMEFIPLGEFISFVFELADIIMNDSKYDKLEIPGDSDYAVGSMMDLMREAGFDEDFVNEVPKKIDRLIQSFPEINTNATEGGSDCPVDVKVYDSTGALVGYIKDNVPQVIEGGIKTEVDENEQKLVYMDGDKQYKLEIIATDDGEVTFFTQTYNIYTKAVSHVQTYSDMMIKKGDIIRIDIMPVVTYETPAEDGCSAETPVKLVNNAGEEVKATAVQKGTQVVSYNVTAESSNTEAGTVTGGGSFYNGEFCKVTATAKDGYEFKGWMEDGKLVSSDAEYRFEINADHNIVAEFTKKSTTEGGDNSGSGNSGSGNSGSGNSGSGNSGGSSGGYSGGGSSGGYSGGGSSGGVSGGGSAGGTSGGVSGGSTGGTTGGGTTGTGNTGNGGSGKTDGKDGDTSKEFKIEVGAVYTDENGIRYSITAIKGTKKATANTVKYIGPEKSSVKKIVIPNTVIIEGTTYTVTELDTSWTKGNKKLTTVVINDNIKKIPTDAFNGCKALKSITFGAKVTTIGTRAFYNCAKLKTVKLPAKLTKIGSKAFYGCSALEGITIPSMVESISSYAFYRCRKLYKVTIKSKHLTDKKIGKKAFAGIVTNAVIKVPKSVLDKYTEILKKAGVTKNMTVTK